MQRQDLGQTVVLEHLDRIFPIVDAPSARLMKVKARCVFDAGAISAAQRIEIDRRADAAIGRSTAEDANSAA